MAGRQGGGSSRGRGSRRLQVASRGGQGAQRAPGGGGLFQSSSDGQLQGGGFQDDLRLPSRGSLGRPTAPSQGGLSREPEGILQGPSQRTRTGYDQAADMYRAAGGYNSDPNAAIVYAEREMGVRHPQPYQAAVQEALAPLDWTEACRGVPRTHLYSAPSVAGWREDICGRSGELPEDYMKYDTNQLTSREQMSFRMSGSRMPGTDPRWDMVASNDMISGIVPGAHGWSQRVHPQRPYLRLRGNGGDARVIVRAGISRGGGETQRAFIIGGGNTASFNLMGCDNVTVEIPDQQAGARLEFMWCIEGLEAGDQTLYDPARFAAGGAAVAVPEGAFALILQTTDPAWQWTNTVINAAVPAQTLTVNMATNLENRSLGTRFIPSIANEGVWLVRPI